MESVLSMGELKKYALLSYKNTTFSNNTQIIAKIGPPKPITVPPSLKSDCFKCPVLKAIALGGEETGKNNAQEALKPMSTAIGTGSTPGIMLATGIKIVAVAVLLIMLERSTVTNAKINIMK